MEGTYGTAVRIDLPSQDTKSLTQVMETKWQGGKPPHPQRVDMNDYEVAPQHILLLIREQGSGIKSYQDRSPHSLLLFQSGFTFFRTSQTTCLTAKRWNMCPQEPSVTFLFHRAASQASRHIYPIHLHGRFQVYRYISFLVCLILKCINIIGHNRLMLHTLTAISHYSTVDQSIVANDLRDVHKRIV